MSTNRFGTALRTVIALAAIAVAAGCGTTDTPAANTATSPTPTQSTAPAVPVVTSIQLPAELAGQPKLTDAAHNKFVTDTEAAIKAASPTAQSVIVGYYGTADPKKNKLYVYGATMSHEMNATYFDKTMSEVTQNPELGKFADAQQPSQGELGGSALCGQVAIQQMPTAVCGWYVGKFVVVVWWYNRTAKDLVAELPAIRGQVEVRS